MANYCCTQYDDNAKLLHSFCIINLPGSDFHCPPRWMETLINDCPACPKDPSTRTELTDAIELDAPGLSQYAVFEDDPRYYATPEQASGTGSSDQSADSSSAGQPAV